MPLTLVLCAIAAFMLVTMSPMLLSAVFATLMRVLTLAAVLSKPSMAESCERRLTATPRWLPSPAKVVDFCPVLSCRVRSSSWVRRPVSDWIIAADVPLMDDIVITTSQLHQGVEHVLD